MVDLVQFLWRQYWQLAQLKLRSLETTALAAFLNLTGYMQARLTTRTPRGLRWTSLLCQYLLGFRCLSHVSIDPWKSFQELLLPCRQRRIAVSCELTVATVTLWMNLSKDKFCQLSHQVPSICAFWDKLRKLRLEVLTSESSCFW